MITRWIRAGKIMILLLMMGSICGCSSRELEDKSYPMSVGIEENETGKITVTLGFAKLSDKSDQNTENADLTQYTVEAEDFYDAIANYENSMDKELDCGHIRALILGPEFLGGKELEKFLNYIQKDEVLARNVLLFEAGESMEDLFKLNESLSTSLGEYLEGMIQNDPAYKENAFATVGTLMNQRYSRNETLQIPVLYVREQVPVMGAYRVIQGFQIENCITPADFRMAMVMTGGLKKYAYYLEDGTLVELSGITTDAKICQEKQGPVQTITIKAEAVLLNKKRAEGAEEKKYAREALKKQLMDMLSRNQKKGVDLSNSYIRLGGSSRDLYKAYQEELMKYSQQVRTECRVELTL